MTDSSSFSSLMALVDSHLSKTAISESRSDYIPSLIGPQMGTLSDTRLSLTPNQRLPMPSFGLSESPIQSVLAEQVGNMLKARELKKKQEEEKKQMAEQMKQLKLESEDDCVIDLMQALQVPCGPGPPIKEEVLSSSSSCESLFEAKFIDCEEEPKQSISPEPLLPCKTDMSYILHQKIKKGKCSPFGRVLCARWRPYIPRYRPEIIKSDIVRFDFSTPSPCDLIKEKQRKPTSYAQYQPDIINFV